MRKLILSLALVLAAASARAAPMPETNVNVGPWRVGGFTNDQTGKFSHCTMYAAYSSGIAMGFYLSAGYGWRIGWAHPSWTLTKGQRVEVSLFIDGAAAQVVTAVAVNQTLALAELPASLALFDRFKNGYQLRVVAQGNTYTFNLDGTNAALTELRSCVARQVPTPPPAGPPPPIVGAAQAPQPSQSTLPAEQRLEVTTLVANVLSQGDLAGYRILTAKEVQDLGIPPLLWWDVVWHSDDLFGVVKLFSPNMGRPRPTYRPG